MHLPASAPLSDAYACCDADLRLTAANEAWAHLLGQPAESLLGEPAAVAASGFAAGPAWLTALACVRETGSAVGVPLPAPATGDPVPPTLEVWPVLTGGRVTALLSVVRATLPAQAEAVLSWQRAQLARANGHLENFVYTAAHDLQGPVSNLSLLLRLMQEQPADAERHQLLEHMHQSVRQLEDTMTDLVEVLEVQSTFRVEAHRLTLAEACANVQAEFSIELQEAGAAVDTDFSALPAVVYVRGYLHSILRNLLSNAIKYRSPDRPLKIRVRSWPAEGLAGLSVQDNGLGMDLQADGHKLFRPFSRLTTQATGRGIGLHLVQNIVERNGGYIQAESQPNEGSTFTCLLREYTL
jgi:signal transduction histidine kinase